MHHSGLVVWMSFSHLPCIPALVGPRQVEEVAAAEHSEQSHHRHRGAGGVGEPRGAVPE